MDLETIGKGIEFRLLEAAEKELEEDRARMDAEYLRRKWPIQAPKVTAHDSVRRVASWGPKKVEAVAGDDWQVHSRSWLRVWWSLRAKSAIRELAQAAGTEIFNADWKVTGRPPRRFEERVGQLVNDALSKEIRDAVLEAANAARVAAERTEKKNAETDEAVLMIADTKTRKAIKAKRILREQGLTRKDPDLQNIFRDIDKELEAQAKRGEKANKRKAVRAVLSRPHSQRGMEDFASVYRQYNRDKRRRRRRK